MPAELRTAASVCYQTDIKMTKFTGIGIVRSLYSSLFLSALENGRTPAELGTAASVCYRRDIEMTPFTGIAKY